MSCLLGYAQPATPFGHFTGTLKLQPTGDGVNMTVLERYSYTDIDGHVLTAEPGFQTDGASIPRALWTIVGSPFTGKYLGAAVVHDVGCVNHKYSWQVTHRMFYTAMRELGVGDDYAKVLYWGVRLGGPKWTEEVIKAGSEYALKAEAKSKTGIPLGNSSIERKERDDGSAGRSKLYIYQATIQVPLANPTTLSNEDAQRIANYVQQRERSVEGAVTLDQIDKRTPLTGPLPDNAVPEQR